MKVRNGFVSNSSSSSFVVSMKEPHVYPMPKENVLSEEDVKKLLEYGFFEIKDDDNTTHEFRYEMLCNQDDVIEFLLKNSIPFEAECHYGHYHVFYYPKTDLVIQAQNYGHEISTYGPDMTLDSYFDEDTPKEWKEGIRKFTRKEYLNDISI